VKTRVAYLPESDLSQALVATRLVRFIVVQLDAREEGDHLIAIAED
jgi:hypothetical protein